MTWICGIDVGTASTKAVLVKDEKPYLFHQISSGHNYRETAVRVLKEIAAKGKPDATRHLSDIRHGMRRDSGDD